MPVEVRECIDEGQDAFDIGTPAARYRYHKVGGGFSSIIDPDGNDWVGYAPDGGPAGDFRGMPNLVYRKHGDRNNHFHPGHDGVRGSHTTLLEAGPDRAVIESSVEDRWRLRWEFVPAFARLTVLDVDPTDPGFWFLYEGAPGGRFSRWDRWLRSDGAGGPLSKRWESRTTSVDWVAFRSPTRRRSLLIRLETPVDVPVSYYPIAPMTVFGFGRRLGSVDNLLDTTPLEVTVHLLDTSDKRVIRSIAETRAAGPVGVDGVEAATK